MAIAKTGDESTDAAIREAENANLGFAHVVEQLAKTIGAHSHADTIFGAPVTRDGVTVIPVARVIGGFAAGTGTGGGQTNSNHSNGTSQEPRATSGGIGGGGGFMVTPVGMIEIRPEGARFRKLEQALGPWGDVGELVLFLLRRSWSMLRRG
jgi:uncharacterized spore protein YtfJ